MEFMHIRHATSLLTYGGKRILTDPVLAPKGFSPSIPFTPNMKRNPTIDLPMSNEEVSAILASIDAVIVTHRHRDHLDEPATEKLPKELPIISQPGDQKALEDSGFKKVLPVDGGIFWSNISFSRTGGQHGIGRLDLGPVSGFVLQHADEPTVYIAGDTVWCDEVENAITGYKPDIIVVNAGGARFLVGKQITMDIEDIGRFMDKAPDARVIAVHMEAINHCVLTRRKLAEWADKKGIGQRLLIPSDGELLNPFMK